jgi:hypothetical protein
LNYDAQEGQQWFGVREAQPLCAACWQQSSCPREFAYEVARHETFLGMIPLNTKAGWKLVHSARSWIEAAQSFEKNQLGLDSIFLNSLALTWTMSLLCDSVALLRSLAQLRAAPQENLLKRLLPKQTTFEFYERQHEPTTLQTTIWTNKIKGRRFSFRNTLRRDDRCRPNSAVPPGLSRVSTRSRR